MKANLPQYLTGGDVHRGDRVRYRGETANVVFVSDGDAGEFSPGYEDYFGYEPGIMLCNDDGGLMFISEPNEDLEFLRH